jgi:small conductance mechanosensitive channel
MLTELLGMGGMFNETLTLVIDIFLVLAIAFIAARVIGYVLNRSFRRMSENLKVDETQFRVLKRVISLVIYIAGIAAAASMIPGLSGVGISLLASAGILAVVVGFAAQQTLSNIIAGIFIAIFKPFSVGDKVTIKDDYGTVEDITLRHTVVRTWQEKRIIIPNSVISQEYVTNYSIVNPSILGTLEIGISYDSDIDRARKIMVEEGLKHPGLLREVKGIDNEFLPVEKLVKARLIELSDFAQVMRLYYWAPNQSAAIMMKFDLTESIKKRFDREGIEVPFPYRTIVYKKDINAAEKRRKTRKKAKR